MNIGMGSSFEISLDYKTYYTGQRVICIGYAFECNSDIISRVNGKVISRGEAYD